MDFLKSAAGKIISGAVVLAVIAAAISWWQTTPAERQALLSNTGRVISWLGVVLVLPWATFFLIARVGRLGSNSAGAVLIGAYTLVETALLAWLFGWHAPSGATAWTFVLLGVLFAAVYNLFACDWIAEKME